MPDYKTGKYDGAYLQADLEYVSDDVTHSRRFIGPGFEINTAKLEMRSINIRDARRAGEDFVLDTHGFTLLDHHSAETDFRVLGRRIASSDNTNGRLLGEERYAAEICALVQEVTGADLVLPVNCMLRKAVVDPEHAQPPGRDVHVDVNSHTARRRAEAVLAPNGMAGRGFSRFLLTSLWRAFSEPPQDWPLALCDARTLREDEGISNYRVQMEKPPTEEDFSQPFEGGEKLQAGTIFHYNPAHRWFYYPRMS
jgi:hypothetical protein